MSKHTPGPWTVAWDDGPDGPMRCVYAPETRYWVVGNVETGPIDDEDNARLIAAAPDLLAALKAITPTLPGGQSCAFPDCVQCAARAAIARAESTP